MTRLRPLIISISTRCVLSMLSSILNVFFLHSMLFAAIGAFSYAVYSAFSDMDEEQQR